MPSSLTMWHRRHGAARLFLKQALCEEWRTDTTHADPVSKQLALEIVKLVRGVTRDLSVFAFALDLLFIFVPFTVRRAGAFAVFIAFFLLLNTLLLRGPPLHIE